MAVTSLPYMGNPNIWIQYELDYKGHPICPGTIIKFKNIKGRFVFKRMVTNTQREKTWIDCQDTLTGQFRSFYIELFRGPVIAKKSRRKKIGN